MKRKVVQHGPGTLTISLPAEWVRKHRIARGDDLAISCEGSVLRLSPAGERPARRRQLSVTGMRDIIPLMLSALYKAGCDDITIAYREPGELEELHRLVGAEYIGLEIVEEDLESVRVKDVSASGAQDLPALIDRIFAMLLSCAEQGSRVASERDARACEAAAARGAHVLRLTDFCRRALHRGCQHDCGSDAALYSLVEQLERLSRTYAQLHRALAGQGTYGRALARMHADANALLRECRDLFCAFSLERAHAYVRACRALRERARASEGCGRACALIEELSRELHDLAGSTMTLRL